MQTYNEYSPTAFDRKGAFLPDQGNWLVVPCGRNRDSGCLLESNFHAALKRLGGESDTVQVHRFGHWACGWFEIIIVAPDSGASKLALDIDKALEDYPVLNEDDWSQREIEKANQIWQNCYNTKERIQYIRSHRSQFDFREMSDLLGCVRGRHFAGYASELIR